MVKFDRGVGHSKSDKFSLQCCRLKVYAAWPIGIQMFHDTLHTRINVVNWYKHRIWNMHMVWSAFVSRCYGTAGCCTIEYQKRISNSNLAKFRLPWTHCYIDKSFWNFANSIACSVQTFKMIMQMKFWTKEISRNLNFKRVLYRYPILKLPPSF